MTLMECMVAISLLGVFTLIAGPFFARIQEARVEQSRREAALTILQNLIETGIATGNFPQTLSPTDSSRLPHAELTLSTDTTPENDERITYALSWQLDSGRQSRAMELSCWRFPAPFTTEGSARADEREESK